MKILFAGVVVLSAVLAQLEPVPWPDGVNCGSMHREPQVEIASHGGHHYGRNYARGMRCRFVFDPPASATGATLSIVGPYSFRRLPADFAVFMDGEVAVEADFICRVQRYLELQEKHGEDKLMGKNISRYTFIGGIVC